MFELNKVGFGLVSYWKVRSVSTKNSSMRNAAYFRSIVSTPALGDILVVIYCALNVSILMDFPLNGEISDVFTWRAVLKRINVFCLLRLYWVSPFSLCLRWGGEVAARRSVRPHLHSEGTQVGGCAFLTWELHVSKRHSWRCNEMTGSSVCTVRKNKKEVLKSRRKKDMGKK
jgi:hypothetical protein